MSRPNPTNTTAGDPPLVSSRYAWYVVCFLTLIYVFAFIDRQILSMMIGDLKVGLNLERDWHAGFLMGPAFAIFYTLFGIPFGRLADTKSRRLIISGGLGLWSFFTAGCGLARHFWQMALMRVGVGVGEASLSPSAYSIISDYFPKEKLGRAIAFYGMGIYFGSGMAYMIGGRVITYARGTADWHLPLLGTVAPWQKVFFVVGLPGLLLVPLFLLTIREPVRKGLLRKTASARNTSSTSIPFKEVLAYTAGNWKTMLTHNSGFALLAFSGLGATAWLPEVFRRVHQWDADKFGLTYGAIIAVFGTLGTFCGGYFSDLLERRGYRDSKIRVGLFASWIWFPFGIIYPLLSDANWAMFLVIFSVFFTGVPAALGPASIQEMVPNNLRGQTSAMFLLVVNIMGLAIGPLILALMTDFIFTRAEYGLDGIRYSLLWCTTLAHVFSTLLLWKCMRHFRESRDRLDRILAEDTVSWT